MQLPAACGSSAAKISLLLPIPLRSDALQSPRASAVQPSPAAPNFSWRIDAMSDRQCPIDQGQSVPWSVCVSMQAASLGRRSWRSSDSHSQCPRRVCAIHSGSTACVRPLTETLTGSSPPDVPLVRTSGLGRPLGPGSARSGRLDLDGFAASRRDRAVTDLGIHPSQLSRASSCKVLQTTRLEPRKRIAARPLPAPPTCTKYRQAKWRRIGSSGNR